LHKNKGLANQHRNRIDIIRIRIWGLFRFIKKAPRSHFMLIKTDEPLATGRPPD